MLLSIITAAPVNRSGMQCRGTDLLLATRPAATSVLLFCDEVAKLCCDAQCHKPQSQCGIVASLFRLFRHQQYWPIQVSAVLAHCVMFAGGSLQASVAALNHGPYCNGQRGACFAQNRLMPNRVKSQPCLSTRHLNRSGTSWTEGQKQACMAYL